MATVTSAYDKKYLNDEDLARVERYKQDYANATTDEERAAAHAGAESVRSKYAYSGGGDGNQYLSTKNLNGLSPDTNDALNKYGSYTPSESVTQAQNYLTQMQQSKPGAYVSQWDGQIMDLYNRITNREPFRYDLNGDMLYQQYKDQYVNLGQMAMMDTMGQAAGLTGGYANTYAQNAGQQAYQAYLQQLNDVVPELYGMARDQYNQEGQELYNQFSMVQSLDETEYGRYRDTVSDYYTDLGYATDWYNNERNFDFDQFTNAQDYAMGIAGLESDNRAYAYDTAMQMIQSGVTPSADLLNAAGISAADAQSLVGYYQSRSTGRGSGGGGGGDTGEDAAASGNYSTAEKYMRDTLNSGGSVENAQNMVDRWVNSGFITESDADKLVNQFNLR